MKSPALIPPDQQEAWWKADIERRVRDRRRRGQLLPSSAHPVRPVGAALVGWWSAHYTSATAGFVPVWSTLIPVITHKAIVVYQPYVTSGAASAQLRVHLTGPGIDITSTVLSIGANVSSSFLWDWQHGITPWKATDITAAIELNVIAAGSAVDIFPPYGGSVVQREPVGAVQGGGVVSIL